jgi:hypothetical protein
MVRVMRTLVTFRGRHLGIAQQVYLANGDDYGTGSAGGSVDLLRQILHLTKMNARLTTSGAHRSPG